MSDTAIYNVYLIYLFLLHVIVIKIKKRTTKTTKLFLEERYIRYSDIVKSVIAWNPLYFHVITDIYGQLLHEITDANSNPTPNPTFHEITKLHNVTDTYTACWI